MYLGGRVLIVYMEILMKWGIHLLHGHSTPTADSFARNHNGRSMFRLNQFFYMKSFHYIQKFRLYV